VLVIENEQNFSKVGIPQALTYMLQTLTAIAPVWHGD